MPKKKVAHRESARRKARVRRSRRTEEEVLAGLQARLRELRARVAARSRRAAESERKRDEPLLPRFSPAWLASHRAKLELSAADYGELCGVTGQSIYNWEQGRARPRRRQLEALAEVRALGRAEAWRRLGYA